MNFKLLFLAFVVLSTVGCKKDTFDNYFTSDEIIQLAQDLAPEQTELTTVERLEFDETVDEVTHGLIFKYSGINEESLNTTIAIPLTNSGTVFSISSTAQLICKKVQGCTGFCAVNRWLNCECFDSVNGNCTAINENHNISPGRVLDPSLSVSIYP
ncbi:hypothetical protein [Lewinella sp. LCG006]|uniref:hypothetical protein n=1 Tax=Lewinella sp. LCG006 TaxID=3231911 RepID=UPI00345FCAEA